MNLEEKVQQFLKRLNALTRSSMSTSSDTTVADEDGYEFIDLSDSEERERLL